MSDTALLLIAAICPGVGAFLGVLAFAWWDER